jgi:hypothetical protein
VVGRQTASLTPGPSFAHSLGYRCPNRQCKGIFDIYVSRPFQRYQEHPNARCFAPCCRALNIRESRRTPNPHFFQVVGFTPTLGQSRVATIRLPEVQLQRDPEDEPTKEILLVAQGHLADSLQEKVVRNHQLSSASWFRYRDTCSKRFFDFHRIGRKRTPLKELKTEGGGHHGPRGPGPICPIFLCALVHLRGQWARHVGSPGVMLG